MKYSKVGDYYAGAFISISNSLSCYLQCSYYPGHDTCVKPSIYDVDYSCILFGGAFTLRFFGARFVTGATDSDCLLVS